MAHASSKPAGITLTIDLSLEEAAIFAAVLMNLSWDPDESGTFPFARTIYEALAVDPALIEIEWNDNDELVFTEDK